MPGRVFNLLANFAIAHDKTTHEAVDECIGDNALIGFRPVS